MDQVISPPVRFKERWIFISILLINVLFISSQKYFPSMDGPSHLYNSNILLKLLRENQGTLHDFFKINSLFIPNWLSHAILAIFRLFLPAWLAEKFLIILYVTGLSCSFRLLLKQLNRANISYSVLIFPFAYSFLFHLGFYNYCLSFIVYFFALHTWFRIKDSRFSLRDFFTLVIIFIITYYASILTFFFLGFTIGVIIIAEVLTDEGSEKDIRYFLKRSGFLALAALPGLIMMIFFIKDAGFGSEIKSVPASELIKWLNDVRPLIVYNYAKEEILTEQFLHLFLIVLGISLYYRFIHLKARKITLNDFLIFPLLLALILLFILPTGGLAGMMSDRLILMFYVIFLIFISVQPVPGVLTYFLVPLVIILHFSLVASHFVVLKKLNRDVHLIEKASDSLAGGSIVLPVDLTENWLEIHFSNYLGTEKELLILDNYEASVGWFPVKWNTDKMPHILLDSLTSVNGVSWPQNPGSKNTRQIDYIFLYGDTRLISDPQWKDLKKILDDHFLLHYSDEGFIEIYMRQILASTESHTK